jgi:hypothetical protein
MGIVDIKQGYVLPVPLLARARVLSLSRTHATSGAAWLDTCV